MTHQTTDIAILGAGLSGLYLAYLLKDSDYSVTVLEARDRIGGRILTKKLDSGATIEMGATWFGKNHQNFQKVLKDLGIDTFPQQLGNTAVYEPISTSPPQIVTLPPNEDPSFRIAHGTSSIIQMLYKALAPEDVLLDHPVRSILKEGDYLRINAKETSILANIVVSTLPPCLFVNTIECIPALPTDIIELSNQTHTWMGESIKIGLSYSKPFWREGNSSGTIFSNVGPIPEMYDHSNIEDDQHALKGFLNGAYYAISKEERLQMVLNQLKKYYGNQAEDYLEYEEQVWAKEPFTFLPYEEHILPHQNNGNPLFQTPLLNGQLILSGTETAPQFPGYMEGAILSAEMAYNLCLNKLIQTHPE